MTSTSPTRRALALALAAVAGPLAVLATAAATPAAAAGATTETIVATEMYGYGDTFPEGVDTATTTCPSGTQLIGLVVHTNGPALEGTELRCQDPAGTEQVVVPTIGDHADPTLFGHYSQESEASLGERLLIACATGESVVGLNAYVGGWGISSIGLRCQDANGVVTDGDPTNYARDLGAPPAVYTAYDCPNGVSMNGITQKREQSYYSRYALVSTLRGECGDEITFAPVTTGTYGGSQLLQASTGSGTATSFTAAGCEVTGDVVRYTSAGTCTVTATAPGAAPVSVDITVAPAPLTITAQDATRSFGAPNPALTADVDGLVAGDALAAAPSCTTPAGPDAAPGSYPITCSAAAGPNYTTAAVPGVLTVSKAATRLSVSRPLLGTPTARLVRADTGAPIAGKAVVISATPQGRAICTATTNSKGEARCSGVALTLGSGPYARFAGDAFYGASAS